MGCQLQELGFCLLQDGHSICMLAILCRFSPFRFEKLILDLFLFGDVTRDFGESAQTAGLVTKRGDDDVGPKARAILSDPPAFRLEPTMLLSHGQALGRYPCGNITGRVEGRQMSPEDLVGLVTLDPFCALVPARHVTAWIHQEDRIVFDAVDQQVKALFAGPQLAGGDPGLGEQHGVTQRQDGDIPELSKGLHVARFKWAILPTAHGNRREDFALDDERHGDAVFHARELLAEGSWERCRIKCMDHGLPLGHQPLKLRRRDLPATSRLRRWAVAVETAFDHYPITVYPREGGSLRLDRVRYPLE